MEPNMSFFPFFYLMIKLYNYRLIMFLSFDISKYNILFRN